MNPLDAKNYAKQIESNLKGLVDMLNSATKEVMSKDMTEQQITELENSVEVAEKAKLDAQKAIHELNNKINGIFRGN